MYVKSLRASKNADGEGSLPAAGIVFLPLRTLGGPHAGALAVRTQRGRD